MVGPIPEAERTALVRRLKLAIVLVVAVSAGLIAVEGDAPLAGVALSSGAGLVVGALLVRLVFPARGSRHRRDR